MKKVFLQIGVVFALVGGVYSVSLALPAQQMDLQHQNQIQFQAQPQIPNLNFDLGAGVLGQPPIDYKANVTSKADNLVKAIEKASIRVSKVKYLTESEEKEILEVIKDAQKKAERIKNDADNKNDFNQASQEQFMLKMGSLFESIRLEIPKIILEKQIKHGLREEKKIGVITDKIWIYSGIAKKQGVNVDVAEEILADAGKKITSAFNRLNDAQKLMDKITPGVNFNDAKEDFKDANKKLKLAYQNIEEAKSLSQESIVELKKATNK